MKKILKVTIVTLVLLGSCLFNVNEVTFATGDEDMPPYIGD